ncbi:hypothetical protein F2Q69_00018941 [Brassica cretica]|uniref:Homeobox domain-containing protein n=1 Tax=Brassica cretica TaxID=69181 RepID=A0A8S9QJG7_BRACR|nr:hypothetical protein F2Q69_00018941 [Brassica cretica]
MDSNHDSSSSYGLETSMSTTNGDNKIYHRHSIHQIQRLEAYFKECPHPDDMQRHKLGEELKLKPKQIKFWFQNKRTQAKAQSEKVFNASLRAENIRIRHENEVIQEALKTVTCPPCGGPRPGKEERELYLQKMRAHNAYLKRQREQISDFVNNNGGHSIPSVNSLASTSSNPHVSYGTSSSPPLEPPSLEREPYTHEHINNAQPPQHFQPLSQMEKMMMSQTMVNAVTEIIRLIHIEEPMWIKSSIDDRLVIDQENYEKSFTNISHLKSPSARIESSKEVVVVPMDARNLVDMFFDTEKWARIFSTIVNEAKTIHVLESMDTQRQNFSQLIYEQLHILSPLVPPREFMILRCCQQIEDDLWVIADVSCHHVNIDFESPTCSKRPSGCLIQALPNGLSKLICSTVLPHIATEVMWMEHVEVNEKVRTHRIYRDLLCGGFGYGARRWTVTLERMCERLHLSSISVFPTTDLAGEGRRSLMNLGERMLKNFAWILKMSGNYDFSQLSETNSSGVRVSVRVNSEAGQPTGLIVCAASSLCLPLSPLEVYNFLTNLEIRHQWDVLCHGYPAAEVAGFATGTDNKNRVNILQTTSTTEDADMMIIQDSFRDALGGMVVYAPVDLNTASAAVSGQVNPSGIPILPSGFIISSDGHHFTSPYLEDGSDYSTSLLTVAFQILVSGPTLSGDLQIEESTTTVNTLITSTLQRIKVMLNCNEGHVFVQSRHLITDLIILAGKLAGTPAELQRNTPEQECEEKPPRTVKEGERPPDATLKPLPSDLRYSDSINRLTSSALRETEKPKTSRLSKTVFAT